MIQKSTEIKYTTKANLMENSYSVHHIIIVLPSPPNPDFGSNFFSLLFSGDIMVSPIVLQCFLHSAVTTVTGVVINQ